MRIGIITDSIDDNGAGITTYTRNLVKNVLNSDKNNEYFLIHYRKDNRNKIYKNRNIKHIIIPLYEFPFYRQLRKLIIFPLLLRKYNLDVVHEPTQIGPFFFKQKYKMIVTIHDLAPLLYPKTQGMLPYLEHKIGLKIILKNVHKIITVSENTKEDIIRIFRISPKKIHVTYEAAENDCKRIKNRKAISEFKRKNSITFPFILYVGTIEPRKNIPALIRAFNEIRKQHPTYKLIIVGKKGWKYKCIFKLIEKLNLKNDIISTGFIPRSDLVLYYNTAELFVWPSLYEGFGLPILEAMKCGCPVLASQIPTNREIVKEIPCAFNPKDPHELCRKMQELIQNNSLRNKRIKQGLKTAQEFSWRRCAEETLHIYSL
ncbi:MAG TPA: glycosyltransferase family 1 protein [Candidatus Nanoarchaeia archaeon]|nr:glycosyltransferase family 1 protein [Candidatus Nanoarchaeia archaeon]